MLAISESRVASIISTVVSHDAIGPSSNCEFKVTESASLNCLQYQVDF